MKKQARMDAHKTMLRRTTCVIALVSIASILLVTAPTAKAEQLPEGSYEVAQNTFNQQPQRFQQPQAQPFQQQQVQQFRLVFENASGANIDLLRNTNGRYQLVAVLQNGFGTPIDTFVSEQLFLGYGGSQILSSFNVTGDPRPIQIGPELLARAGIQLPGQQQNAGLLPPPVQNPPQALPQPNGGTRAPVSLTPDLPPPAPVDLTGAPPPISTADVPPPSEGDGLVKLTNLPWSSAPNEAMVMLPIAKQSSDLLTTDRFGNISLKSGVDDATTASTWYFAETENADEFTIRSVENPDAAIFVGTPGNGQLVSFGPEGTQLTTGLGLWKKTNVKEGGTIFMIESVRFPKLFLYYDNGLRVKEVDLQQRSQLAARAAREQEEALKRQEDAYNKSGGKTVLELAEGEAEIQLRSLGGLPQWAGYTIEYFKVFKGFIETNSAAFAQLNENARKTQIEAEKERVRQIALQEAEMREAEEKRRAFEARFDKLKEPTITGSGDQGISVRLGVDKPFEAAVDLHALEYKWPKGKIEISSKSLRGADGKLYRVFLDINPEVYAIAKKGSGLTLRVKTPLADRNGSVLNQARVRVIGERGNQRITPNLKKPEGVFYIGGAEVTVGAWRSTATSVLHTPINALTDVGTSADTTTGFDVSLESVGGNSSSTIGSNTNSSINDYKILGTLQEAPAEVSRAIGRSAKVAKYNWTACGLANVPTNRNNCVYNSPSDLWENEGGFFRDLKPITVDFNLLETDTTFEVVVDPERRFNDPWLPVKLTYDIELHMVDVDRSAGDADTAAERRAAVREGIFAAPEFMISPKKWSKKGLMEFANEKVNNNIFTRVPTIEKVRMDVTLYLHIDQLKPFL